MQDLKNISYYQFNQELDYPVFVKFEAPDFELNFQEILKSLGFSKVDNKKLGKIKISPVFGENSTFLNLFLKDSVK